MIKRVFFCAAAILTMLVSGAYAQVTSGQAAPNFTATDTNGKSLSLADYKGKFVVLEWFSPDCPFVKKHYNSGNIPGLQKQYTAKGVVWISIDSSASGNEGNYPPVGLNQFMSTKAGAPTAIIADPDGKIGHLYGAQTTPHMFIIDPQGNLIYQGAIDDTPSTDIEDLKTAKNYVSAALDAAMGQPPHNPVMRRFIPQESGGQNLRFG